MRKAPLVVAFRSPGAYGVQEPGVGHTLGTTAAERSAEISTDQVLSALCYRWNLGKIYLNSILVESIYISARISGRAS